MTTEKILEALQEYLASKNDEDVVGNTCDSVNCPIANALSWKTGNKWRAGISYVWVADNNAMGGLIPLQPELMHFIQLVDNVYVYSHRDNITVGEAKTFLEQALQTSQGESNG